MRDCSNVQMRELLPDLIHDRLPPSARAGVQAHVDDCADCRDDLELLRRVRGAARTPAIDVARIVEVVPPYRAPSLWSRAGHSPLLRIAAVIVLVVGSVVMLRRSPVHDPDPAAPTAVATATELTAGEPLSELTEGDLRTLIAEIEELDAVTPIEADDIVPSLGGG